MRTTTKIAHLALGLSFLFLTSCVEKKKEEQGQDQEQTPETEEEEIVAPDGIISLEEAKLLCENYETRRIPGIKEFEMAQNQNGEEFVATQFIDFDFKTIQKYVKFVERKARKAKVKPEKFRIYLGNYGTEGQDPNRNTVFILPTTTIDGDHGGFFINENGNAELISNYWPEDQNQGQQKEPKSKASMFPTLNASLYQGQSLTLNRGNSGPPPHTDF